MKAHCELTRQLLDHYQQTLRDRQIYWMARERAKTVGDLLVIICDSYDKAKVTLPRWPFQRCPKKAVYEKLRRRLPAVIYPKCVKKHLGVQTSVNCLSFNCVLRTAMVQTCIRYIHDTDWVHRPWIWSIPLSV